MCQKHRIPPKPRAHIQGPHGPLGQPAAQCRPDVLAVTEEIMPAASARVPILNVHAFVNHALP